MHAVRETAAREVLIPALAAYGLNLDGSEISGGGFSGSWDGEKFPGGFGDTHVYEMDYETLRARSNMLFTDNLYARGLIRRLITNEINTGLKLEATPEISILGLSEDQQYEWSDKVEKLYGMWSKKASLVDFYQKHNMMELERMIRREALIMGDVLVVMRYSAKTRLPMVQVIGADKVVTPLEALDTLATGHTITHGVEQDSSGRVVAHWVKQDDDTTVKRIPACTTRTGRRVSWLVYGTEQRIGDVRGTPMLALVLQSLKELDRYRDSTQRKALINSILALFISQEENTPPTAPYTAGALKRSSLKDTGADTSGVAQTRVGNIPGMVMQRLQKGEKPNFHNASGQGEEFGTFENAIIHAMAWANELPPTILKLAFTANFAASQAEINELKIYLQPIREMQAGNVNQPVYEEWLIASVMRGDVSAPKFEASVVAGGDFYVYEAWTSADWAGAIKVAADIVKQGKGYGELLDRKLITYTRASREVTGMKFSTVLQQRKRENKLIIDADRELREFEQEFVATPETPQDAPTAGSSLEAVEELVVDLLDEREVGM
jgi:lambda family phage portal protein